MDGLRVVPVRLRYRTPCFGNCHTCIRCSAAEVLLLLLVLLLQFVRAIDLRCKQVFLLTRDVVKISLLCLRTTARADSSVVSVHGVPTVQCINGETVLLVLR